MTTLTSALTSALTSGTDLDLYLTSLGAYCTSLIQTEGDEENLIVYTKKGGIWVVLQPEGDITVIEEEVAGDNIVSLYDYKGSLLDYYMADMGYGLEVIQHFNF